MQPVRLSKAANPAFAASAPARHQGRPREPFTRSSRFRQFAAATFRMFQRMGINITPRHFYWPIPDLNALASKNWTSCSLSDGVDLRLERQLQLLKSGFLASPAELNFSETETQCEHEFHFNNGYFERVDAEVAYSMVRQFRPRKVIEIGSGHSTRLMAAALCRNHEEGSPGELIGIEPYPSPVLKRGFPGFTELILKRVQDVPLEVFRSLEAGDILFIDSSHVVAVGSDVVYEILQILPKLKPGVIVHVHDIFMPADYPEKFVMTNLCFWGEQYMLEAFLSFNRAFELLWASSAMQFHHRDVLEQYFPRWAGSFERMPTAMKVFTPTLDGRNVWPCSLWMQKTAD
jgi:predicted O-methyltransferase YrrM